jgi:UDP-N-acetyl-D-glucosamine/UDP-N-acetyl-D-galactosamine dehydrogenase
MKEKIAVVGLGYVGLPVAVAFARVFSNTVGFDVSIGRVEELRRGVDRNHELTPAVLKECGLQVTSEVAALQGATFFVVAVPTPVDTNNVPDLTPVIKASETVGRALTHGSVVVYESTVYPGVTEEIAGPILARVSGLKQGVDFKLGYSPERINPGDQEHSLERVTKVVSGEDTETLNRVAAAYGAIIHAGVHKTSSIKVAEAAKVIENTQRDLNIALMNELAIIFDLMGIRTSDVLAAAGTKWNFLRFSPGLVGGHCIGVDPYYLTMKAQQLGYQPEVILAGRRINNRMGAFVAQRLIKMLIRADRPVKGARVGVFGLTFKEDCNDLRNSRVPDIIEELHSFGVETLVHDPLADAAEAKHEYGITLDSLESFRNLDAVVVAVKHREYINMRERILESVVGGGVVVDVKGTFEPKSVPPSVHYWSL